jgi:hypothetical protein
LGSKYPRGAEGARHPQKARVQLPGQGQPILPGGGEIRPGELAQIAQFGGLVTNLAASSGLGPCSSETFATATRPGWPAARREGEGADALGNALEVVRGQRPMKVKASIDYFEEPTSPSVCWPLISGISPRPRACVCPGEPLAEGITVPPCAPDLTWFPALGLSRRRPGRRWSRTPSYVGGLSPAACGARRLLLRRRRALGAT